MDRAANGSVGLTNAALEKTEKVIEHAFAGREIEKF